jgi:hypothetical protein
MQKGELRLCRRLGELALAAAFPVAWRVLAFVNGSLAMVNPSTMHDRTSAPLSAAWPS